MMAPTHVFNNDNSNRRRQTTVTIGRMKLPFRRVLFWFVAMWATMILWCFHFLEDHVPLTNLVHFTPQPPPTPAPTMEDTDPPDYVDDPTDIQWLKDEFGARVLYIVTSMSEFDNGHRNTKKGRDRFTEILIPVVKEACASMRSFGYQVDLYLITYYELRQERFQLLRDSLPDIVGIEVWDDAAPLGYGLMPGDVDATKNNQTGQQEVVQEIPRALARQHRYVIKDKFRYYSKFVAFEDDMLIKGDHVNYFEEMTMELHWLRQNAPIRRTPIRDNPSSKNVKPIDQFYGELTKIQLARLVPGFIRVEVVDDKKELQVGRTQPATSLPQSEKDVEGMLEPRSCCHTSGIRRLNNTSILEPKLEDIFLWETQAHALGIHKLPESANFLEWIALQRGIEQSFIPREKVIGEYWVGQNAEPKIERPNTIAPQFINNQGGWMGIREEIFAWHRGHCKGLFLPPFDDMDGLKNNVEFWSGGLNLVGMNACQLQRFISLDPSIFSQQLVYHTSNNKQKSKNLVFTNVQDFWEQLNTARQTTTRYCTFQATTFLLQSRSMDGLRAGAERCKQADIQDDNYRNPQ
ncbi:expressed unknown protein [Seminavis robusta]|uniref:Uncharacterized protein n=1 Tax=Seminavis robusta TaxID=568900 RepID=A0A9N8HDV8_9STRA|nr:expressed unknown protein [Seminavis robusta]|eukprot:Sro444_g144300.1 n/a (576) ;mRNA; r:27612-29545